MHDCILSFGKTPTNRYKIFDIGSERNGPIIGGEFYQSEIVKILKYFKRQGFVNKLITLHGPNGSAKTSTIEALAHGLQLYSQESEGALYKFNWVFPLEKSDAMKGEGSSIGFHRSNHHEDSSTYAYLDDSKISCKISSELCENPIFLLPMPHRENFLGNLFRDKADKSYPEYLSQNHLSKRNQLILESLLNAYDGDFSKVSKHIQVERMYYSKQYRVGVASVEPQVVVDAQEKQLTYEKNISNLPVALQNIRLTEMSGPIIDSNRGMLEYSDLLKRPLEALKYLLTTVEKSSINMNTATNYVDTVFFATTNEKQLDAFKATPEFSSFTGRIEFITVPYLLNYELEQKIYNNDIKAISNIKKITPHAVELLCLWAVMTRLKQPDLDKYDISYHALLKKLTPLLKAKLYASIDLENSFSKSEYRLLSEINSKIMNESKNLVIYEGRFGASPREIKMILNKSVQTSQNHFISPMDIFVELEAMIKNLTVYEFLQYEPRNGYHDAKLFIKYIKDEFSNIFENELLDSMNLVNNEEYDQFFSRYLTQIVASLKKEKYLNSLNGKYEDPSEDFMTKVEDMIAEGAEKSHFRNQLLNKIAAHKLDNPSNEVDTNFIFKDLIHKLKEYYYKEKRLELDKNFHILVKYQEDKPETLSEAETKFALKTFENMQLKYHYSKEEVLTCMKFSMNQKFQPS